MKMALKFLDLVSSILYCNQDLLVKKKTIIIKIRNTMFFLFFILLSRHKYFQLTMKVVSYIKIGFYP